MERDQPRTLLRLPHVRVVDAQLLERIDGNQNVADIGLDVCSRCPGVWETCG